MDYPIATIGDIADRIERIVRDPSFDIQRLREALEFQRELLKDHSVRVFNAQFHELQRRIPRIPRNGLVDYTAKGQRVRYNFGKFEDTMLFLQPHLEELEFNLSWDNDYIENNFMITKAILDHTAGHSKIAKSPPLPPDVTGGKNAVQSWGSAQTYGQRYALKAMFNIVFEDDPLDDDARATGVQFITDEQIDELARLGKASGMSDPKAFLDYVEASSFETITTRNFEKGRRWLAEQAAKATRK
jgi:hypothetical protein